MASPGELIKTVAEVFDVPEVTIASSYRALREAGYVTKGGRGRSAAHMTPRDAGALLIAICGSRFEREAAGGVYAAYSGLQAAEASRQTRLASSDEENEEVATARNGENAVWKLDGFSIPLLQGLPNRHSLADALAATIASQMNGDFPKYQGEAPSSSNGITNATVSFLGPSASAEISFKLETREAIHKETIAYNHSADLSKERLFRALGQGSVKILGDLQIARQFTFRTISTIAALLKR